MDRNEAALRDVGFGILFLIVGLVVTIGTYSAAARGNEGGHYILAYGPIVVGLARLVRGVVRLGSA